MRSDKTYISTYCTIGLALALLCFLPSNAIAQACNYHAGVRTNELYKYDAEPILEAIRAGCDPRPQDLERSGFTSSPTSAGSRLAISVKPAHRPQVKYNVPGRECRNSLEDTKAGGAFDGGATNSCILGRGNVLTGIDIPLSIVPNVGQDQVSCLGGLLGALSGALSGGFNGATASIGNGAVTGNANASGGCLSGSISICGLASIGGSICPGTNNNGNTPVANNNGLVPQSRYTPVQYAAFGNIAQFDYARTDITQQSTVACPQGCLVQYGQGTGNFTSIVVPAGEYVTMDANGYVFGRDWQLGGSGSPIQLTTVPTNGPATTLPPTSYVTITPNLGALRLSNDFLVGNTLSPTITASIATTTTPAYVPNGNPIGTVTPTTTTVPGPTLANGNGQLGSVPPATDAQTQPTSGANQGGPSAAQN